MFLNEDSDTGIYKYIIFNMFNTKKGSLIEIGNRILENGSNCNNNHLLIVHLKEIIALLKEGYQTNKSNILLNVTLLSI